MRKNIIITGEAYQPIVGCLKIDKIVIAVLWSYKTQKIWELNQEEMFDEIKNLLKDEPYNPVRNHEGGSTTDKGMKRHREFSNEDHMIEIFHTPLPRKTVGEDGEQIIYYTNQYQAYIRITNTNFFKGDSGHVEIAIEIEKILDKYHFPHFLGTGRERCELALDFPAYDMWKYVDDRLLWKWTGPQDYRYYDPVTEKVLPGFDPLKNDGAQSHYVKRPDEEHKKVRRFFHMYIDRNIRKYRLEGRFDRPFLKDHEIESVWDLLEKGKALMEGHLSLWEPDIDKILRQRHKYKNARRCAEFHRRTENYYRKLVATSSVAEVLANLCEKLKDLSPYEIKLKCFKRLPGPEIKQTPFKRERTIPRIEYLQDELSNGNDGAKMGSNTPIFMHEMDTYER
jgi:hypothetical protein